MDQLSRPYQIALAALLVFALAWFAVLKPKPDSGSSSAAPPAAAAPATQESAAQAPGVAGLSRAIDKAKGAAKTSDAANARVQAASASPGGSAASVAPAKAATPATAASTPAASATKPAAAHRTVKTAHDLGTPLIRALHHGKTVVVVFYGVGSDDAYVRDAVKGVSRHGGKVVVRAIPVSKVGRYAGITRGVQIDQGPTTLVIGPNRKAHPIIGLTDTSEIDQLVADTL